MAVSVDAVDGGFATEQVVGLDLKTGFSLMTHRHDDRGVPIVMV